MTTMPALGAYLAAREQSRVARLNEMLTGLTPRETELVREAAVMGFVQGNMAPRGDIPNDNVVMFTVLRECDGMGDLYPMIHALPRRPRKRPARRS